MSANKTHTAQLAEFMVEQGFATGHGDSVGHLLSEFSWQLAEMRTNEMASKSAMRKWADELPVTRTATRPRSISTGRTT